jgi:hypothetical protein
MANDRIDSGRLVAIREARLLAQHLTKEEEGAARAVLHEGPGHPPPPIQKYLYIFSSDGLDYGLKIGEPDCVRNQALLSHQHMAALEPAAVNPPKSGAAGVDRVEREVYFDSSGLAHEISIAATWKKARHLRPHPLFGKAPSSKWDELEEKLLSKQSSKPVGGRAGVLLPTVVNGKERRYYLFLSPIRLGPKALQFAKDNPDALSIYCDFGLEPMGTGKISGPGPKTPKWMDPEQRARRLSTLSVVDPYAFAERIRAKLLAPIQDQLYAYLTSVENGDINGVERRHFLASINRGSISELVALANIVSRIQAGDDDLKKLVDQTALEQVLGIYGARLENHVRLVETAARFYANWLTGPQHEVIDLGVIDDLKDTADDTAAVDKATSLAHWFCQFRAAQATGQGAGMITQALSDATKLRNPVRELFLKYSGEKPAVGSTDIHAMHAVQDLVPDLALYTFFQFKPNELDSAGKPIPDKSAPARAKALVDLINNIRYFNTHLGSDPAYDPDKDRIDLLKAGKYAVKTAIYVKDTEVKQAQWVADAFKTLDETAASNSLFRKTLEKAFGFEPLGPLLKSRDVLIRAETDPEFVRRSVEDAEKTVTDLRDEVARLQQAQIKDGIKHSERFSPVYSGLKARQLVLQKELEGNRRELSKLTKQLGELPPEVVGKANGPEILRRKAIINTSIDIRIAMNTDLATELDQVGRQVQTVEDAAGRMKIRLEDALRHAQAQAAQAENTYQLAKNAQTEADALTNKINSVNQRIKEVTDQNQGRQKALSAKADEIGPAKVYASKAFLLLEFAFFTSTMTNDHATDKQRLWATLDLGKALVDLAKDELSVRRIRPELIPKGDASKLFIFSSADGAILKQASALRMKIGSGLLGFLGGLHTVCKYGPTAVDDWRNDDTDAAWAAGIAAFGGVVTIVVAVLPFSPWMSVTAASGVGAIASLLTAAGILVYIFVVDSEHEKILKNCYFAKNTSQRNHRFESSDKHWMGPADPAAPHGFWGVREQLAALQRLSCRSEMSSRISFGDMPTDIDHAKPPPEKGVLMPFGFHFCVEFYGVPPGSSFSINIIANGPDLEDHHVYDHFVAHEAFTRGARHDHAKGIMTGFFAPADRPGFLIFILRSAAAPFFHHLSAHVKYQLPDGSTLVAEHVIAAASRGRSPSLDTPSPWYYYEVNEYPSPLSSFEEVPPSQYP